MLLLLWLLHLLLLFIKHFLWTYFSLLHKAKIFPKMKTQKCYKKRNYLLLFCCCCLFVYIMAKLYFLKTSHTVPNTHHRSGGGWASKDDGQAKSRDNNSSCNKICQLLAWVAGACVLWHPASYYAGYWCQHIEYHYEERPPVAGKVYGEQNVLVVKTQDLALINVIYFKLR